MVAAGCCDHSWQLRDTHVGSSIHGKELARRLRGKRNIHNGGAGQGTPDSKRGKRLSFFDLFTLAFSPGSQGISAKFKQLCAGVIPIANTGERDPRVKADRRRFTGIPEVSRGSFWGVSKLFGSFYGKYQQFSDKAFSGKTKSRDLEMVTRPHVRRGRHVVRCHTRQSRRQCCQEARVFNMCDKPRSVTCATVTHAVAEFSWQSTRMTPRTCTTEFTRSS
ncbi:hypothetical protein AMTR_s00096p00165300 [Amborella trichopoda]|uniref:Uncharacterized protein n=1 Tax=Amborella trichopoda TaxID=13333 RepID=W1P461_AMBTC|nr:hypothetical protein AMTR_s00096p00165300 [Amborella trichopoda]